MIIIKFPELKNGPREICTVLFNGTCSFFYPKMQFKETTFWKKVFCMENSWSGVGLGFMSSLE